MSDSLHKLSIFAAVIIFGFAIGAAEDNSQPMEITDWEYQWSESTRKDDDSSLAGQLTESDWRSLPGNLIPPKRNNRTVLWLRATLPDKVWRDPTLFLPGVLLTFKVYVDGAVVADFPDLERANSYPWYMVPLANSYPGKTVILRVYSYYSKIGITENISIGSRSDHIVSMIRRDITRASLGFLYLVAGIVALVLAVRNKDRAYIAFGLLVLASAGYTLRYTHIKQFVYDNADFWFYAWFLSLTVMNVAFLALIENIFGSGRWAVIRRLLFINMAISAACIGLFFAYVFGIEINSVLSNGALNMLRIFYIIDFVVILVFVSHLARRRNVDARLFLISLPIGMLFAGYDAAWAMGLIPGQYTMAHWSSFCYLMALVAILARRYGQTNRQLVVYAGQLKENAEEKAHLVRDLHDGIGAITTNISLLAEMAQRDDSSVTRRQTLATISDLSRQGLEEIRGYMYSMDQDMETWSSLFADLRRYGVQTIEPHDLAFEFNSCSTDEAEPPSSVLTLNLFRIYKEALINVVKHAHASVVSINIVVDPNSLILTIHDNGVGLEESRVHKSIEIQRGLTSMVARAERLGGNLAVTDDSGVLIECVLPIPLKYPTPGLAFDDK